MRARLLPPSLGIGTGDSLGIGRRAHSPAFTSCTTRLVRSPPRQPHHACGSRAARVCKSSATSRRSQLCTHIQPRTTSLQPGRELCGTLPARAAAAVGGVLTWPVRSPRSILNKITPEKFEKLSDQVVTSGIESADLLRGVISLIFDKAVSEPGFCALYARLCVKLSKALPEFPPLEGEDKPMTFRRILLNTCQEEFEGAEKARQAVIDELAAMSNPTKEEEEYKMRKVCLLHSRGMPLLPAIWGWLHARTRSTCAFSQPAGGVERWRWFHSGCGCRLSACSPKPAPLVPACREWS